MNTNQLDAAAVRPATIATSIVAITLLFLLVTAGCSPGGMVAGAMSAEDRAVEAAIAAELAREEGGKQRLVSKQDDAVQQQPTGGVPAEAAPYPDRSNPFEFAMEVDFDETHQTEETKFELRLYGFVGDEDPKAIINVYGETRIMSTQESWRKVEMLEINPPEIRVRAEEVIRVYSLIGQVKSDSHSASLP